MPLAYSYIRMSTDIQLKGDSLRRQKEASVRYAAANDLTLVENFQLEDIGISAFKGKNASDGALGRFLHAIETGEVAAGSYLLVESLDRISREHPFEATALFLKILKSGVNIVTLADQKLYSAGKAEFGDLIYSIVIMGRAHEESQTKSMRLAAVWENKRKGAKSRKLTSMAPAWVRLSSDRATFELIEEHASIIRRIFDDASKGVGSFAIARRLNAQNVPPLGRASAWHPSYVTKILQSRAVLGEYQPHQKLDGRRVPVGAPIPDYFPAVVSEDQFLSIQSGRRSRRTGASGRKGPVLRNLFTNVARCGYCGATVHFVNKGESPKGGHYLRCSNALRNSGCVSSSWRYQDFEQSFLLFVTELDLNTLLESSESEDDRREFERKLAANEQKLHEAKSARERLMDLLTDAAMQTLYLKERYLAVEKQIGQLEKQKEELESALTSRVPEVTIDDRQLFEMIAELRSSNSGLVFDRRQRIHHWLKSMTRQLLLFPDGPDDPNLALLQLDEFGTQLAQRLMHLAEVPAARSFMIEFSNGDRRYVEFDSHRPAAYRVNRTLRFDDGEPQIRDSSI